MTGVFAEYGRKTSTVDAVLVTDENAEAVAAAIGGYVVEEIDLDGDIHYGINYSSMGEMARVSAGQYLIRAGEDIMYTKPKAVFEAAFEKKEN